MAQYSRRGFLKTTAAVAAFAGLETAAAPLASGQDLAGTFRVGVGSRDVTPPAGVAMWGYSDRKGPATGALDPLYAKALVLQVGDESLAIVALDLGRVPIESVCERIRARAEKAGVGKVIFTATHTHGGPVMESDDAPHVLHIEEGIGAAIEEAQASLRPARVGAGRCTIDISHNRRVIKDGKCYMLWRNEKRFPTSPVDHEATVFKFEDAEGAAIASLVHYACHPVVLGSDNIEFTGDYAGEATRLVKERTGAECLFLQGAAGDINPYLDKTPLERGGLESMRGVGRTAGEAIVRALEEIAPERPQTPSLAYEESPVPVGLRWDFSNAEQRAVFESAYGSMFDRYLKHLSPDLTVSVGTLVLNGEHAFAFMPGELFVQFQIDLKQRAPLSTALLCGYANGFHIYFPTVAGAAAGGYGGNIATYVGLGAGEKMTAQTIVDAARIGGKAKTAVSVEDFNMPELG